MLSNRIRLINDEFMFSKMKLYYIFKVTLKKNVIFQFQEFLNNVYDEKFHRSHLDIVFKRNIEN